MIAPATESMICELLAVLDEEIALLERKRVQLADLSEALVAGDNDAIEGLLEQIEQAENAQTLVDLSLKAVRGRLADVLGCDAREMRLSRLITELPADQAGQVDNRRRRIVEEGRRLRRQHLQTAMLLAESARINRMLLESILPTGESVVTYGADGRSLWRNGTGLVNREL